MLLGPLCVTVHEWKAGYTEIFRHWYAVESMLQPLCCKGKYYLYMANFSANLKFTGKVHYDVISKDDWQLVHSLYQVTLILIMYIASLLFHKETLYVSESDDEDSWGSEVQPLLNYIAWERGYPGPWNCQTYV